MSKPVIVDGYCRVSTDPQEDNTSLDEQERCIREYCAANGLMVGIIHRETWSGYQYRERDKLSLMRERYRDGKVQGVVVRTFDRLSRKQVHAAVLMEEMEHYSITFHCVMEPVRSEDKAMDQFIRMVLAFVAEMEREKIMDRTTTGRINKAKQGQIVAGNKAPYGWDWLYTEVEGSSGKKEVRKEVILHAEQVPVLRWLAEQYADGVAAYSLRQQLNDKNIPLEGTAAHILMQQLRDTGIPWPPPSPNGIEWNDSSILNIITDTRITGKNAKIFAYQRRKTKQPLEPIDLPDGTYPAIISEELFARVLERREVNKGDAIRANREPDEYLLRAGFVRCAYCKKPMMASKHRQSHTYRCFHTELGHTNVILSKPLDERIWNWLQQLADHTALIEQAITLATSTDTWEHDVTAIEQSIENWQATANNYLGDLDDRSLIGETRTAVRNGLNNANKMILQLQEERLQLMAGAIDKDREKAAYEEILDWCKQVKGTRGELSYTRKRDFLRMLGVVVVIANKKPYYENLIYRTEIFLPTIQELIAPYERVNCDTSSLEEFEHTVLTHPIFLLEKK